MDLKIVIFRFKIIVLGAKALIYMTKYHWSFNIFMKAYYFI